MFSFGFKIALVGLLLGFTGVSVRLFSEITPGAPTTEIVSRDVKVTRGVEYGRVDGMALKLDVYEPRTWSIFPRPTLIMIHGGGWTGGDKASEQELAASLVPKGFVAFAINYRLLQGRRFPYPTQIRDARRAVRWVRLHANEFGADPDRLGAVGWSAGGQLAGLLGTTDVADPDDPNSLECSSRVDCVVDTAGPSDFTAEDSPAVGPSLADVLPALFPRPRGEDPDLYRAASPAAFADAKSAPTLILHGALDEIVPVDQSRRFHRALRDAGAAVRYVEIPDEGHGFLRPDNHRRWTGEIADFLTQHLTP